MPKPRPFLFDIGNVICSFDFDRMLTNFSTRSRDAGAIAALGEAKDQYESGEWGDDQFIEHVSATIGFEGDRAEFVAIWNDVFAENLPMASLIAALSVAGHPLYLLSNTNALHLEYLRTEFAVFEHFEAGVFSHEAGVIKPRSGIYEAAIERFALRPNDTLYIDDLAENIATGERLGFVSHHYAPDNHAGLLDWLAAEGIEVPA